LDVFVELPNDALTPIAPTKATSTIRRGKIFRGIFLAVDIPFLTGTVKLWLSGLATYGRSYVSLGPPL
jgi:hypothetical protein